MIKYKILKKILELYEQMYKLCKDNKWGDPFSYARGKEIYMANKLGHTVAQHYQELMVQKIRK